MHPAAYDLHIHTALSPCADNDMTPQNIVNMAILKGLDVIAVTDHNTCKNAGALMAAAAGTSLLVLPGMEAESAEEAHFVCLFPSLAAALEFDAMMAASLPGIPNRPDLFGSQLLMDEHDNVVGEEPRLLVTASRLTAAQICDAVRALGGTVFPSHVDKDAYSILASLGCIPDELGFLSVEVKRTEGRDAFIQAHGLFGYRVLKNSDAHYLGDISEREHFLHLEALAPETIIQLL